MKNLSLFKVLFLALAVFAISSCGEDGTTDPSTTLSPIVDFLDGVDITSTDADLSPGESFTVNISAAKGDNDMSSLSIFQDDALVDFSRITFGHTSTANNPQLILDADVEALDWTITITAQEDESESVYDFEITDTENNKANAVLTINTVNVVVTDFTVGHSPSMGCFTADAQLTEQTNFCMAIDATRGPDAALSTVTVYENNDVIDISRLNWAENPLTLLDAETTAFSDLEVNISSHTVGTSEYRMVVTDANGTTMEAGIFVTIGAPTTLITGVLLNSAGIAGTGGCDLNTGAGTGSTTTGADIKDEGIDTSQPLDANWVQRISGTNGSEIRAANNLPEGFKFNNIAIQDEIIGAFDASDVLTSNITAVVSIDDEFVIRNSAGEYFFIKITNVQVTTADNLDQYTFDIKQ